MANIESIKFSMLIKQLAKIDNKLSELYDKKLQTLGVEKNTLQDQIDYYREEKGALIEELKICINNLVYKVKEKK